MIALLKAGANPNPTGHHHPLDIAETDSDKSCILRRYGALKGNDAGISWSDLLFGGSDRWKMKTREAARYNRLSILEDRR